MYKSSNCLNKLKETSFNRFIHNILNDDKNLSFKREAIIGSKLGKIITVKIYRLSFTFPYNSETCFNNPGCYFK